MAPSTDPMVRSLIRQRWRELRPLLEQAMALPAAKRTAWLDLQISDADMATMLENDPAFDAWMRAMIVAEAP